MKHITFEETVPYWKMLWENCTIRPKSGILLLDGFDKMMNDNEEIIPTFFGVFRDDRIVGVNSGYSPAAFQYRSRGLYVLPEYRRQGIAKELLKASEDQGRKENKNLLWSMPRREALPVYLKFGFKSVSNFFKGRFGENCFVIKTISKSI